MQMNIDLLKKDEKEVESFMYTEDQLMARLKFFIGVCLTLTLTGIVFVVLYSIIFVTQPLNAMSPIDQKFFEMLIPISTFLTGILSGIMLAGKDDKEAKMKALEAATRPTPVSPNPTPTSSFPSSPARPSFTPSPPPMSVPPGVPLGMPPMPGTTTISARGPLPPPPGAVVSEAPTTPPPPVRPPPPSV